MRGMKRKRKGWISLGTLWILMAILLFIMRLQVKDNPDLLEKLYPVSINQKLIGVLSQGAGIFPFSVGEMFVFMNVIFAGIFLVLLLQKVFRGGVLKHLYRGITYVSVLFVVFMMIFGFNYERASIRQVFSLEKKNYGVEELYQLNLALIEKANDLRSDLEEDENGVFILIDSPQEILSSAKRAYEGLQVDYPMFQGSYGKAKGILSSELLNYTGITGVFMPFTGEANVNVLGPDLFFPSTILHEMAHQRCVAYEGEANYVAYVASSYHEEAVFQYSGTMLALIKTMNALYRSDLTLYKELRSRYSEGLHRDLQDYGKFYEAYEGKINENATKVNDTYLKSNGQSQGVRSYDDMVELLLEQFMQSGKI